MTYFQNVITTKKFPATDSKGARIKAKHPNGSKTMAYNPAWNSNENHETAAELLAAELGIEYAAVASADTESGHVHILWSMIPTE